MAKPEDFNPLLPVRIVMCAWHNFTCIQKASYRIEVNGVVVANYCIAHIEDIVKILTEVRIDYAMRALTQEEKCGHTTG